eukprot:9976601-Ditylum_brightwellii.AAC.1
MEFQYKLEKAIYDNHNMVEEAELKNKYTEYMGVTSRDIIDHLLDWYGKIAPSALTSNSKKFQEGVDMPQPIDAYFTCINDCIQYAPDRKAPFTLDCLEKNYVCGRQKTATSKTWENFKTFFVDEYCVLKEEGQLTANKAGFCQANVMQDVLVTLDNLANAAMEDRSIIVSRQQCKIN